MGVSIADNIRFEATAERPTAIRDKTGKIVGVDLPPVGIYTPSDEAESDLGYFDEHPKNRER